MSFLSSSEFAAKAEQWCRDLSIHTASPPALEAPALLVLDMQNEFLCSDGQLPIWGGPAVIPNVRHLISAFHQSGRLVIFTRHLCLEPQKHKNILGIMKDAHEPEAILREGSGSAALHKEITPNADNFVIPKYAYSAFYNTPLDTILAVNKIRVVIVTGVATNICCEATAHDAFFRGYSVLFTSDATGGTDEAAHLATLRNIRLSYGKVATTKQVIESLPVK